MGFFDDIPSPDPKPRGEDPRVPEWLGAPENWLAGVVPIDLQLVRSPDAAVFLTRLAAYPFGFAFDLNLLLREMPEPGGAFDVLWDHRESKREDLLSFGLEFPDGRRATARSSFPGGGVTSTMGMTDDGEGAPNPETDLFLQLGGGSGGSRQATQSYWVWPLPPDGVMRFVCEWAALGIPETSAELDCAILRQASTRAQELWD